MLNLVLKDILLLKKTLLYSLVYVVFFIFVFQSWGEGAFPSLVIALTYISVLSVCAYDDKNKSDVMLNSLPVKRGSIVLSKYMFMYIIAAAGTIVYSFVVALIRTLGIPVVTYGISLLGFLTALFAVTLMYGVYFPIFFKFGYIKSRIFNLGMFFTFFFGIAILADFVSRNENKAFVREFMDFVSSITQFQLAVLMVAVTLAIAVCSYLLSLKFYKQREF